MTSLGGARGLFRAIADDAYGLDGLMACQGGRRKPEKFQVSRARDDVSCLRFARCEPTNYYYKVKSLKYIVGNLPIRQSVNTLQLAICGIDLSVVFCLILIYILDIPHGLFI